MTNSESNFVSGDPPTVVQQTTVINVGSTKSVGLAVALSFFFGPIGMLYSTGVGAIVMFFVNVAVIIGTAGLGLLITIPIGMIWAGSAASSHNKSLGVQTQAVAQRPAQVPAAWHPDPNGSGRLRYWNGQRWTDHYSETPGPGEQTPPKLEQSVPASASRETECPSCSATIAAGHKFCPECGTARGSLA